VSVRLCSDDELLEGTVELTLRQDSPLHRVYPSQPFREILRGRRPFALSTRGTRRIPPSSGALYGKLEREYLIRRGLISPTP
jgi:hypothetical protein